MGITGALCIRTFVKRMSTGYEMLYSVMPRVQRQLYRNDQACLMVMLRKKNKQNATAHTYSMPPKPKQRPKLPLMLPPNNRPMTTGKVKCHPNE